MLRPGDRIADWIVDAPLGEGAMGAVYRVHSALSGRVEAALKVMKPSPEPHARDLFIREAGALSALRHPAIVHVMGFNEDPERGLLCLVMELAEGPTLRQRLAQGAMELPEALRTFVPLASALDHAHGHGIFHRDLKPANVILCADGPRLVDFGIAAATTHAPPSDTEGQMGTLAYLPPEVFRGLRAEPAAMDVYAFGLLLHEALTGKRCFAVDPWLGPADAATTIGRLKLEQAPFDPEDRFPAALRDMVRRATGPDPAGRPTMREVLRALESLLERRMTPATTRLVERDAAHEAPSRPSEATVQVPEPPWLSPRRRRVGTAAAVALIAAVTGAALGWCSRTVTSTSAPVTAGSR